ncbi:MAG: COX15/CtaA family protein [Alphaproteobacteria bacterium]
MTVQDRRAVAIWLFGCCAMVVVMMLIGATTRLTESGLSITEWQPIVGAIPPLSDADWQRTFDLYRQSSEYQLQNAGMSLAAFKTIFWWEYIHRLWGRAIGFVFLVPFLWFLIRGRIGRPLVPHLVVMFLLGGLQGFVGWWMVKSGLVGRTDVSQYRLAAHLGMAFLILGYMLWTALGLLRRPERASPAVPSRGFAIGVLAIVGVTALAGALVAGMDAGMTYNTWPLMDGQVVPPGYLDLDPFWLNAFENVAAVQFHHRMLAYTTVAAVLLFWMHAVRRGAASLPVHLLAAMAVSQMLLGIATLLMAVPVGLGVLHQAGAVALFCLAVWTLRTVSD